MYAKTIIIIEGMKYILKYPDMLRSYTDYCWNEGNTGNKNLRATCEQVVQLLNLPEVMIAVHIIVDFSDLFYEQEYHVREAVLTISCGAVLTISSLIQCISLMWVSFSHII